MAGYGVGPKKMSEHFCYIAAQRRHVNLGFYYGAELPDPEHLLHGPGKLLRHITIRSVKDVERHRSGDSRTPRRRRHITIRSVKDVESPAVRELLEVASTYRMPVRPSS